MHVILCGTGMVRLPPRHGGAVESHVQDIHRVLSEHAVPVTLVSDIRRGPGAPEGPVAPVGSPIDRFPLSPAASAAAHLLGGFLTGTAASRVLSRLPMGEEPLLHLHEEISAAYLSQTRPGVRKVFTLHNPPPSMAGGRLGPIERALRGVGAGVTRRWVARHADRVLAPTNPVAERLVAEWGLEPERVGVLRLPVDTTRYVPGRPEAGRTDLLYVGRLDNRKNVASLLRMMPGLEPEIRLTLVGDGPLREPIRRVIQRNGWGRRVRLLVAAPIERLVELYRSSSVFVFPSTLESCGRVIVEAASCGLPVVLPELPIYQDFIDQGFAATYPDAGGEGLRETVEALHQESRWRLRLGRRARASAIAHHSYPVFGRRLLDEYARVAA